MGIPAQLSWIVQHPGRGDMPLETAELPEDAGALTYRLHALRPGLEVYSSDVILRAPMTLRYEVTTDEPYLWIATNFSGCCDFRHARDMGGVVAENTSYCAMLRDRCTDFIYTPARHRGAGVAVTPSRLKEMLQDERVPRGVEEFLRGKFDPRVLSSQSVRSLRAMTEQIFRHPYQGAMASLFLEAKAFEMLAETFRVFMDDGDKDGAARARKHAYAARDILMADLGAPPRIADLAREVGVSQRQLNEAFHLAFDASPLTCLVQWRLDMAYRLLASGAMSVKQVAWRVGYAHVSNFSLAFTRRFGHPPTGTPGE